jgi:hypothetical protein
MTALQTRETLNSESDVKRRMAWSGVRLKVEVEVNSPIYTLFGS